MVPFRTPLINLARSSNMLRRLLVVTLLALPLADVLCAQEPVFSGPQPGEKLTPFKLRGVFGDLQGKEFDLVGLAGGKPLAIVFIHKATRPSVGMTRILMEYAARRSKEGLVAGVVYLEDDVTEAENFLKRAGHAFPTQVPIGISLDGREGPGAYGLNRNVELTILVAQDNLVRANFALVQPSIQSDAVRVAKEFVAVSGGGQAPTLADLGVGADGTPARQRLAAGSGELEPLLRALIRRDGTEKSVEEAATAIEKLVATNAAAKTRLGEIAARIVRAGKVQDYGTPPAQKHIRAWAEKFGPQENPR
jgi:hypothetical protein